MPIIFNPKTGEYKKVNNQVNPRRGNEGGVKLKRKPNPPKDEIKSTDTPIMETMPKDNSLANEISPVMNTLPKSNDKSLVSPALSIFEEVNHKGNNPNTIEGNVALFGTLFAKALQFFTRTGKDEKSVSTTNLRGNEKNTTNESLLPPELEKIVTASPEELVKMSGMKAPENINLEKIQGVKEVTAKVKSISKKNSNKEKTPFIKKTRKKLKKFKKGLEL